MITNIVECDYEIRQFFPFEVEEGTFDWVKILI
jgi:hypothetical protein